MLIIEDSDDDAELLLAELRRGGYDVNFERVDTASGVIIALERQPWDVVIADYVMPRFSAPAALRLMKEREIDLPFIIVSGKIGEEIAVESLKGGAHDFIVKGNLARLIPAIEREMRESLVRKERKKAEDSLKKLSRAVEQTADSVIITSKEGVIEYVNSAFEQLTGYTAADAIGNTPRILTSGEHAAGFYEGLWTTILSGRVFRSEFTNRKKDGELYFQEEIITPVRDSKGQISHFVSTGRDVTERKRADERIARQLKRLAALRDIDKAITTNLDLSITLRVILARVTGQLHVDAAAVLLLNRHSQTLDFTAGRGFRSGFLKGEKLRLNEGFAGHAALERHTISIPRLSDIEMSDSRRMRLVTNESFASYYAVPLISKGEVNGVMEIFHRLPLDPDQEWLQFLETLAEQAAIAIDNAALFVDLQRTNTELALAYDTTLEGWSRALELRDQETEGHSHRVTELTLRLAAALGLDDDDYQVHLRRGALLHDIGKMGVPDSILMKPASLTPGEWEIMRKHTVYAYELLAPITFLKPALEIPYCHHEKWDGSGYPCGLKGEEIPLAARIFAIVDVWDALCSNRPYRPGWPKDRVKAYIKAERGTHFDPRIADAFLAMEL
jgi:PAS domain S-box-containing protein/putative nucleotidyltransferase with HDIG domain